MKIKSKMFEYAVKIRESHLDSFGHVNNAQYLQLFEEARWEILTENNWGLASVQAAKQGPVILDIHMQFKKEMRNRELIRIQSWCQNYNGKIAEIEQVMLKEDGDEACRAVFKFGLFDLTTRKLISPTADWLKAIGLD